MVSALCGLICLSVSLNAQQTLNRSVTAQNGEFIGFLEYRPADYASTEKHPMIIFLHGYGEKGNGTTQLNLIHCCGIPSYIRKGHNMQFTWNGKTESFVVLMPQLSPRYSFWQNFYVNELIDYAVENLNIDKDRIFVTGLSLGGGATWAYASETRSNAEKLAGIVPVVGPCMMADACNIAKASLPVLAVHSRDDKTASPECTTNAIRDIINCGSPSIPNLIMYPNGGHAVWLKRAYSTDHSYQNPNVYEWMLAQKRGAPGNKKPVANAGNNITLNGVSSTMLDGSASSDQDGKIVRYIWRKLSGPEGDTLLDANAAKAKPDWLFKSGTYRYELRTVDDRAEWDTDTVEVVAAVDVADNNKTPIAWAGNDTILFLPVDSVTLDGSYSADADGRIVKYLWEPVSGPDTAYIDNDTSAITKARQFITGVYRFRLTVTDDKGKKASDVINFDIRESNVLPVAVAGNDTSINHPDGELMLNGSGSYDGDGQIAQYSWKKISGGETMIQQANAASTKVKLGEEGIYVFELEITDDVGGKGKDSIEITYNKGKLPEEITLYPNPAVNSVTLRIANEERGEIKIMVLDMTGRKVYERVVNKNAESMIIELPVIQYQNGLYTVKIISAENTRAIKLLRRR